MTKKMASKILVVDDAETNIDILMGVLSHDYDVSVAMDGKSALKAVETEIPDIILLDIMMPGMDGYEVCERLKSNDPTKDIPVIFLTAKSEVVDEVKGLELGAVDYITKPISLPVVKARVETHLALKFAREKLKEQNEELVEAAKLKEDVERITRHDLKSPLTSIIAFPDLLAMDDNITEKQKNILKMIQDSGYQMLNMINRSLDLFKMERGTYQLSSVDVNVVHIVEKIITETSRIAQTKNLSVVLTLEEKEVSKDDEFLVQGEELLCYSLFANLIKNAVEASPEGKEVSIHLMKNEWGEIRIHNSGAVPEEVREKFFEKYATSGKKSGTGLGTYSAKLITETQGGTIDLETSEETGTTVTVRLRPSP